MAYQERSVQRNEHRMYVRDHPGAEPSIILMQASPTTYTSTIVCSLTFRRRAES